MTVGPYTGGGGEDFGYRLTSAEECKNKCRNHQNCEVWLYDKPESFCILLWDNATLNLEEEMGRFVSGTCKK